MTALSAAALLSAMLMSGTAHAQTVVSLMHVETGAPLIEAWEKIATDFEASHPDVDVQIQFLENEAFKAKLPTLLQSDAAPDIFYSWGGGVLKEQSGTGALYDLTADMDAEGGAWRNSYNSGPLGGLVYDGKVWAVPYKTGSIAFFYNKEQFAKAGVNADSIKSWDDLLGAVSTLKNAGLTPLACGGGDKWPLHFYWSYLVMRNAGQDAFNAAKANEGDGFNGAPFVKAGEQLRQLGELEPCQAGYLGATWPDSLKSFADGKAAMILGFEATWQNQKTNATDGNGLAQENLGRFAFPEVPGGVGKATDTLGRLNGWALKANPKPEAIEFIKFFTNRDNERALASAGFIIPVTVDSGDAVTDPLMKQSAEQVAGSTWHQNFFDQDLGPAVGRVVNDVSVEMFVGNLSGADGAAMIKSELDLAL
ncbi:MAG: carbohydrate ABC transporter substrate-binding protein [Hyphomicrobiales bacterium]|nr:MAG: carbohydrate ABC transporter substrate-binding protein [Hyphomicrobiales bacterium]